MSIQTTLFRQAIPSDEYQSRQYWLFITLAAFIVAGCVTNVATEDTLADRSFVTGKPCAPPCWHGLVLDQSNKEDVYSTLKGLSFVDQTTIQEAVSPWLGDENAKALQWSCTHPSIENCGGASVSEDRLKDLWFSVGYKLTFKEVVDQLGPPDYVDYGSYHPEVGGCDVFLYWPERGIAIQNHDRKNDTQCEAISRSGHPSPDNKVIAIYYSVREGFGPKPGGCCVRITWPGFAEP